MSSELFSRWVIEPLSVLRKIDNGDGAFAALAMAFGLYERYIESKLHAELGKAPEDQRYIFASQDFDGLVSADDFKAFWEMYRVGIQHHFQPKSFTKSKDNSNWGWDISSEKGYKKYPTINESPKGTFEIQIDPWLFVDHILLRWSQSPELIDQIQKVKFGQIKTVQPMSEHPPESVPHTQDLRYGSIESQSNSLPMSTGNVPSNR